MELSHIKWVFPTAPTRPITVNMGMSMPGWFDLDHLDATAFGSMMQGNGKGFDPPGVEESVEYIKTLVEKEVQAGIPVDRIVVGGFSQGGHVALKTVLQYANKLAGCVAMSTWIEPTPMKVRCVLKENNNTDVNTGLENLRHRRADLPGVIGGS